MSASSKDIKGKVKWWNDAKGFGFIVAPDCEKDVFAHYTAIQITGHRTLQDNQDVLFDLNPTPKGLQAANIRPL
jgi:CspA family cold shock protein